MDHDSAQSDIVQLTTTTPINTSMYDHPSRDERSLLIVMMLAVSNSVLDPLVYGSSSRFYYLLIVVCFFVGCYLVRPVKSNCLSRMKNRTETSTIRRVAGLLPIDKDSKGSTVRMNQKNGSHSQRIDAVECRL